MSAELPRVERDENGLPVFFHHCVDGLLCMVTLEGWAWTPNGESLNPAIHCRACDTQGIWAGAQWVPC